MKLRSKGRKLAKRIRPFSQAGGRIVEALIPVPQRFERTHPMDFAMHWGHARVRARYTEAVTAASNFTFGEGKVTQPP